MKTAIFAIALIASSTASAWQTTHGHKDWRWGSEINENGVFVAGTVSNEDSNSVFGAIARPIKGECELAYYWMSSTDSKGLKPEVIEKVPLQFQIDSKQKWVADGLVVINVDGNTANIYTYIPPDGGFMSLEELLKGVKLKSQFKGKDSFKYTYSLMGSKAAMTAIWERCKNYATAYPEFDPLKQDSETVSKDSEKASKDPEIVSKEFQAVEGEPQYRL